MNQGKGEREAREEGKKKGKGRGEGREDREVCQWLKTFENRSICFAFMSKRGWLFFRTTL